MLRKVLVFRCIVYKGLTMKTLATIFIASLAVASTQAMAGTKDPFAAFEPAGHTQHGNMSKDEMKSFTFSDDDDSDGTGVEGGADVKAVFKPKIVDAEPEEKVVSQPEEDATEKQETAAPETQVAQAAVEPKEKPVAESATDGAAESNRVEKFLDEVIFKRGANDSAFWDFDDTGK